MAVYKDSKTGKWYFRVYVKDPITDTRTQVKRMGFELRRDAIEAEAVFIKEYQNKKVNYSNVTMNYVIDSYISDLEKHVKITTYHGYIYQIDKHIRPFFKTIQIRKINKVLINEWYTYVNNLDVGYKYKNKLLTRLKGIFKFVEYEYEITVGHVNNLPLFKKQLNENHRKTILIDEEMFKELILHARNDLEKTLFMTMFYTGMRISEIRGLKWKDIDFVNKTIFVQRQVTSKIPKAGSTTLTPKSESSIRKIHITDELLGILDDWMNIRKYKNSFNLKWQVFGDMGYIYESSIRRWLSSAAIKANLPKISPHDFRHSYTTLLRNKGISPEIIKEQLGHSSISITLDTYTHITSVQKANAIDSAFNDEED